MKNNIKVIDFETTKCIIKLQSFKLETKEVKNLGNNLTNRKPYYKFKMWMDMNGVKQKEVACLIGKTAPVFCQNINGVNGDLTTSETKKICNYYGISADEYFVP